MGANMEEDKIKKLIARNKELEEERDLIRFIRGSLPKDQIIVAMCNDDFCRNFGNDYIPKSKVREKIKELEKLIHINIESLTNYETFYFVNDYISKVKKVLEELIKEK